MYIQIPKSKLECKKLTTIIYNDEQIPIKHNIMGMSVIQTLLYHLTTNQDKRNTSRDIYIIRAGTIV